MTRNRSVVMQACRFGFVGALTALIYFLLFIAFSKLANLNLAVSILVASAAAIVFNYLGQYHFSFLSDRHHKVALAKYVPLMVVLVGGNSIGVTAIVEYWKIDPVIAQVLTLPLVALLSFLLQRSYVFGAVSSPSDSN